MHHLTLRRAHLPTWAGPVLMVLAGVGLALTPMSDEVGICPVRNLLGTACPGCGMSRATSALLTGDMSAATTLHPLAPLMVAQAVVGTVMWVGHRRGWWTVSPRSVATILGINAVLLVGVWVARAITGTLPPI